jgi:hypothetical protein
MSKYLPKNGEALFEGTSTRFALLGHADWNGGGEKKVASKQTVIEDS